MHESKRTLEECIALYASRPDDEEFGRVTAQDPSVASQSLLPVILLQLGQVERAEQVMQSAFALAERLDRSIDRAVAHTHASEFYAMQRDFDRALMHGREGMQVAGRYGHDPWYLCSMMHAGIALAAQGPDEEGLTMAREGLALWEGAGARVNASYFIAGAAWGLHIAGRNDEALAVLDDAFAACERSREHLHLSMLHRQRGDILLAAALPDEDEVARCYGAAVDAAASRGAALPLLCAVTRLHRLRVRQGQGAQTRAQLAAAIDGIAGGGGMPDLEEARAALGLH